MTKALNQDYYKHEATLSREEVIFFKNELERKKLQIQKNLQITSGELNRNAYSELKDEGDYASQSLENNTNNAIIYEQSKTLHQIERSLHHIRIGTYGICTVCEEPINTNRLKVKIFAEHCISCRELVEQQR